MGSWTETISRANKPPSMFDLHPVLYVLRTILNLYTPTLPTTSPVSSLDSNPLPPPTTYCRPFVDSIKGPQIVTCKRKWAQEPLKKSS